MSRRIYFIVTAIVFALVALLHLLRIAYGWEAVTGGWAVPLWVSWIGLLVAGVLAAAGFVHGRRSN